jgi:hypothetical protein
MNEPISWEALSDELMRRRVLRTRGGAPPKVEVRPWYLSAVLGLSGWLAGLFTLSWVGVFLKPDSSGGLSFLGLLLLGVAFALYWLDRHSAFLDQLALALSVAGQAALTWATSKMTSSDAAIAAWVALMQLALLFILPNRLAKLIATVFACTAWALAVHLALYPGPLQAEVSGWLVTWIPIALGVHVLIATEPRWMARGLAPLARPLLSGLLICLSLATPLSEPWLDIQEVWNAGAAPEASWLALWPVPAIFLALFSAYSAYRLRHRALLGVAIAGALLQIVQFYYFLGITLLMKSCMMAVMGAALLAAAYLLKGRSPLNAGQGT